MQVTLEQAAHLRCPQSIAGAGPMRACIGHACMAWRFLTDRKPDGTPIPEDQKLGFCGLAYSVRLQ